VLVLVAETVINDRSTNAMSLINVIEEFHPAGYPLLIPRFTIYAVARRDGEDAGDAQARVSIHLDDDEVFSGEADLSFGESMLNRSVLQFQGFVLPRPGVLIVRFAIDDESVESYPIAAFPGGDVPEPERLA
jgi:hypothetical protein